ncbi:hypothetical protein D3C75_910280 [compost metagenome]
MHAASQRQSDGKPRLTKAHIPADNAARGVRENFVQVILLVWPQWHRIALVAAAEWRLGREKLQPVITGLGRRLVFAERTGEGLRIELLFDPVFAHEVIAAVKPVLQ